MTHQGSKREIVTVSTLEVRKLVEDYLRNHPDENMTAIATKLNWYQRPTSKVGDNTRLKRILGISPYRTGKDSKMRYAKRMQQKTALNIISIIKADPIDINGL